MSTNFRGIKVVKKKMCEKKESTFDLTVKDVHHYILGDGIVTHNTMDLFSQQVASSGTGAEYGASIILCMNRAKLKDSSGTQTGIIVNAKPTKNRFCKPVVVKFHISYTHGMNKYVGLEEYVSWERCGIQRGVFITEKEYQKSTNDNCYRLECSNGEVKYFVPKDTARTICCDDGVAYPLNKLFTKEVFSEERLKKLDVFLQNEFEYSKAESEEIKTMLEDSDIRNIE